MSSLTLAPLTGRAASLALLVVLWPGLAVATPTNVGGSAYADECKAAGVPKPPDWRGDASRPGEVAADSLWVYKGDQTTLLQPGQNTLVKVYLHKGYTPQGICVALSRRQPSDQQAHRLFEIICQGHTGKVCFWDNVGGPVPFTGVTPVVGGTIFKGGKDLEFGPTGQCSGCHAGENPFIVYPDTTLDLKDSKNVPILNSGIWPDPLVPASWPQNPAPVTGLTECTLCHQRPTHTQPKLAGRLPEVSSTGSGQYCGTVLQRIRDQVLMPPVPYPPAAFVNDFNLLLNSKCKSPPTGAGPPEEIPEAFKGRFVFGDQDMNIYAVKANGELVFYKHTGASNGTNQWSISGNVVGSSNEGWAYYKKMFSGGGGVIYAITAQDELRWFKHVGQLNGTDEWAQGSGNLVGTGWSFNQIFATTNLDGVIYGVGANGQLYWYRHTGRDIGSSTWAAGSGNVVGYGWNGLSRLMAGPAGVIYGVNSDNNLVWTRHLGLTDGTFSWSPNTGTVVGWGWLATTLFTGYQGRIYTVGGNLGLYWYRHNGYLDGTPSWANNNGLLVGTNWGFMRQPYFD